MLQNGTQFLSGLTLLMLLNVLVFSLGCTTEPGLSGLERSAQELNKQIMCPVCPGESIDQSQHPLAVQMKGIISERLDSGWSPVQIKDYLADRYGDSVLLDPPMKGMNLLLWVVPVIGVGLTVIFLYLILRRMRSQLMPEGDRETVFSSEENSLLNSERGCPLQEMLNDLYQPKGALETEYFSLSLFSASFISCSAILGELREELRCAYG